ncbi:O-antigen ligase family protein [Lysinibacillus boronitolerans]|uniref:O-antigen ligase family protein n=1 Tax=Lysinibacillus boronitolerans TaxID=309788 RepID=UPI002161DDB9|nr:O-antigen ligase family protein [Lysinibacillus boronitolerans]MCS1394244.1 O-antigen ligase family protein [Lysinibacillus boronitolerans]
MSKFYEKVAYRDVEEDIQSQKSMDKWIFGLLLIVIGFVPLIVMGSIVEIQSPLITNISTLMGGEKGDLFTHYKALVLVVITILVAILFMAKILFMDGTIRKTKLNYAIGAFAVIIVISTIFSPNISIALHGQYNRSDGAISWLCYLALFFIGMNIEYPKKALNNILYSLYPFVIINLFVITKNFYGNDLLQNVTVQKIVKAFLPAGTEIAEGSVLVGTLNQWNYMSGMSAIMTIMFLTAAIIEKQVGRAIGHLMIAIMSIAVMLMAISTSGFLTICIMMLVVLFIAFRSEKKIQSFAMIAVFLVAIIPIFHELASKNAKVWDESIGFIIKSNPYSKEESTSTISFKRNENFDINWMTNAYAAEKFELPVLPDANWGPGTGRIYIWGKTLELMKERPLLGYGLDTLIYNFPHNDLEARGNLNEVTIVDKPHNIYIGVAYGTGVIGIVIFLGILLFTLRWVVVKIFTFNKLSSNLVITLCVAWLAFLFQSLFNDTSIGITGPLFTIGGIMIGILINNNKEKNITT